MDVVVDTNSLFTFFWKGSLIKKLLIAGHNLYSPKFALDELRKHKSEIIAKTKIASRDFEELINALQELVIFIPFSEYSDKMSKSFLLLKEHPKDVDFLALALKLNASIVSKDKELLKQSIIKIFNESNFSELF